MTPTPAFTYSPGLWSTVHDQDRAQDRVFRNGIERALAAVARLARPGQCWLDLGCGTGHLAQRLRQFGPRVIGIDRDPAMIDFARQRFGHAAGLRFQTGEATALPFPSGSMHGLTAVSLAGCLPDPDAFFREAHRLIQPGGWAVMTFTNRYSPLLRLNGLLQRLAGRAGDGFRYRLYSRGEVYRLAGDTGWCVDRVEYYNCFVNLGDRLLPPARVAAELERTPLRLLGRNLLVVLRRN